MLSITNNEIQIKTDIFFPTHKKYFRKVVTFYYPYR